MMSTTRIPWSWPYQPNSPVTVWSNVGGSSGWEIRMDSLNRLNVYKVTIEWVNLRKKYWIVTRVPWVIAPEYVHLVKDNMQAVLKVIADRRG